MSVLVVVITGCSKGIGQGLAIDLAKDPQRRFKVYATMRNVATNQEDTKTKAAHSFDDTLFIREIDVTKQDTIDKTIKAIHEKEGRIDVLVNNAALQSPKWWENGMQEFYDIMETNYFGCVRMTQAVTPIMKAQRSGKILQISSLSGFKASPTNPHYISSKFALEAFSESIAPPLRKFGVWVSLIEPGYVLTPMLEQFFQGEPSPGKIWNTLVDNWTGPSEEEVSIVRRMLTTDPDIVLGTEFQSVEDVAKVIEDAILSPRPDFRIQTSETAKKMARQRLVDPSGNAIMDSWLKQ